MLVILARLGYLQYISCHGTFGSRFERHGNLSRTPCSSGGGCSIQLRKQRMCMVVVIIIVASLGAKTFRCQLFVTSRLLFQLLFEWLPLLLSLLPI